MFRILSWTVLYICTLGILSLEVEYSDGLHIKLTGWPEILTRWCNKRGK